MLSVVDVAETLPSAPEVSSARKMGGAVSGVIGGIIFCLAYFVPLFTTDMQQLMLNADLDFILQIELGVLVTLIGITVGFVVSGVLARLLQREDEDSDLPDLE